MIKLSFDQGKLIVRLIHKRGRRKKTFLLTCKKFTSYLKRVWRDNRFQGNRISRVLRRILEIKRIKEIAGVNLTLVIFFSGIVTYPLLANESGLEDGLATTVLALDEVKVTTERATGLPLNSFEVSQGYHFFHRAIDFKALIGSPVYAIRKGVVSQIAYSRVGYGNHLIVDHGLGLKSLYAHLGKISVSRNQEVDQNTILGRVGISGWTTGPHLHFEVWQDGKAINPMTLLK
jgi:murein DD-endopeptidase MepM/ murein hydrolase activator NlpD